MKKIIDYSIILSLVFLVSCSRNKENVISEDKGLISKDILIDNFDSNVHGWTEEFTDFHHVQIDSGMYFIKSKDPIGGSRTSVTSLDKSYLIGLPRNYRISIKIENFNSDVDTAHYGLILVSGSVDYTFSIYNTGKIVVEEYDYNHKGYRVLIEKSYDILYSKNALMYINVNDTEFTLEFNNKTIGKSIFRARSWEMMRLYTSNQSTLWVDFFKITKL